MRAVTAKRLVYVVDDDEAVRDSLSALLQAKGYTVVTFASAREFLGVAATLREGVLIADVRMPEIDGLELQQRLIGRSLNFPLIVITGHGDVPLAVRAMKAGAVDFIEKPFAVKIMLDSISAAAEHHRDVGEGAGSGPVESHRGCAGRGALAARARGSNRLAFGVAQQVDRLRSRDQPTHG